MSNPRKVAAEALLRVEKDKAYSNIVLNDSIKSAELNKSDAAFAAKLFYGVLERKITLDYYIRALSSQPLSKVSALTLQVLRCGIYQILFMDKVPDSAAVNEAVKIIKKSKESRSFGYVNAVLRNFLRQRPQLPKTNDIKGLSVNYSCGEQLVRLLIDDYGIKDTEAFLKCSLDESALYIRVNPLKNGADELTELLEKQGITASATALPNALLIKDSGSVESNPLYAEGRFHVQDMSSQVCASLLEAKPGDSFIDLCSAPGGKTFTVCEHMQNNGKIIACELYEHRVGLIEAGAKRLNLTAIEARCADATVLNNEYIGGYDRVLCDVPCSGSGVISRKPDIKYKSFSDILELGTIQSKILANGFEYLKKGGRLVYSTCSILRAENEDIINAFLANEPRAKLISCKTYLPHIDGTDGFFTAVIEK